MRSPSRTRAQTYDPIFSLLPYPGDAMDRHMGSAVVPASSISFANTAGVLFTVVCYDRGLVPLLARLKRPISMTTRIGLGFVIQIAALCSAALIEGARYKVVAAAGLREKFEAAGPGVDPLDPQFMQPMRCVCARGCFLQARAALRRMHQALQGRASRCTEHATHDTAAANPPSAAVLRHSIWWQAIPYFLLGVSEVFVNIGAMELFYTQVSEGMRSLGSAVNLLTTAVGVYLASGLNMAVAAASPHDEWVADNPLYGHYDLYFWLNAGIMTAGLLLYVWLARGYTEKPVTVVHKVHGQELRSVADERKES